MKTILTDDKRLTDTVNNWLAKQEGNNTQTKIILDRERPTYLPRELDHIYYRYL